MARAIAQAAIGIDPGLIVWRYDGFVLDAALVLAPEEPLAKAMSAVIAVQLGVGDSLGSLAPPEVAVHYAWPGDLLLNGARCGEFRAAASTKDREAEPDWLVIGLTLAFLPASETPPPDETALHLEGCGEITPVAFLESAARHTLIWLDTLEKDGLPALERHWRGRAWRMGEVLEHGPDAGAVFMGIDEEASQLLKTADATVLRPLTLMLEDER
ncbi:MAG: biotin/lipoate--protein ligase family protein [Pseudomonadota bacterium]